MNRILGMRGYFGWKKILFLILLLSTIFTLLIFSYVNMKTKEKKRLIFSAMGSRLTSDFVKPNEDTCIIQPEKNSRALCNKSYLVILVNSHSRNKERRQSIRETWAMWKSEYSIVVYFFLGTVKNSDNAVLQELKEESIKYGDLIIDEIEENKYQLTVKTLRMLKYYIRNCPRSEFLLKADDDAFVNVPILIKYMESLNDTMLSRGYVGGLVHSGRRIHSKNPFSKFYVPPEIVEDWTNDQTYPPYVDGLFILFSGKIVSHIFMASMNSQLFHIAEIFLTGIVSSLDLNMELTDIPQIYDGEYPRLNFLFKSTEFLKTIVAYHCNGDDSLMKKLYFNSKAVNDNANQLISDSDSHNYEDSVQ